MELLTAGQYRGSGILPVLQRQKYGIGKIFRFAEAAAGKLLRPLRHILFFAAYNNSEALIKTNTQEEELSMIMDRYGDSILRLAYSYLHNMQDAEDILQDTLIRYIKKAPEFNGEEHRRAWLLRIAANLSKNRIDYNKVREASELNDELIAEGREDLAFVWDAVKTLPEKYRVAIHLFYQEGMKTAEIAQVLDEKETTVRSHLARGREKLKEILKEEYDFG